MKITGTLKAGLVLLTIWSVLEIVVAAYVTVMTLAGKVPPALALLVSPEKIPTIDANAIAVIHTQAAIANPCIIAVFVLVLALAWRCIAQGQRWAFWLLVGVLAPLQGFAFASDAFLDHHNLAANLASTGFLFAALSLCGIGLYRRAG